MPNPHVHPTLSGILAAVAPQPVRAAIAGATIRQPALTLVAGDIYNDVLVAMQGAEELGGPTGEDYVTLMRAISAEALARVANATAAREPEIVVESSVLNHYRHCGAEWSDLWSCACNDRCPVCRAEIEPYYSEQLAAEADDGQSTRHFPSIEDSTHD